MLKKYYSVILLCSKFYKYLPLYILLHSQGFNFRLSGPPLSPAEEADTEYIWVNLFPYGRVRPVLNTDGHSEPSR